MSLLTTPPTLASLPTELLVMISQDLTYNDYQSLRSTSHLFVTLLPLPSDAQLLEAKSVAKSSRHTLIACGGCLRLLPHTEFSTKMLIGQHRRFSEPYESPQESKTSSRPLDQVVAAGKTSGIPSRERFCNNCGRRALPGRYRYQLGDIWDNNYGVWWLRCERCGVCERISSVSDPIDRERRLKRVAACRQCFRQGMEIDKIKDHSGEEMKKTSRRRITEKKYR